MERNVLGTKRPRNESSKERNVQGTKRPKFVFRSWERNVLGTKSPVTSTRPVQWSRIRDRIVVVDCLWSRLSQWGRLKCILPN